MIREDVFSSSSFTLLAVVRTYSLPHLEMFLFKPSDKCLFLQKVFCVMQQAALNEEWSRYSDSIFISVPYPIAVTKQNEIKI